MRDLSIVLALLLVSCTVTMDVAGTDTDTDTGEITGVVVGVNGLPASQATVVLRPADTTVVLAGTAVPKRQVLAASVLGPDTTVADSAGRYRFAGVPLGRYWLEVRATGNSGAFTTAAASTANGVDTVDTLILAGNGAIAGEACPDSGAGTTYVIILELSRVLRLDSTLQFTFDSIPAGAFTVSLVYVSSQDTLRVASASVRTFPSETLSIPTIGPQQFATDTTTILHLDMNDPAVDTARDWSDRGNHAFMVGGYQHVTAPFGYGVELNGSDAYLQTVQWDNLVGYSRVTFDIAFRVDSIVNDGSGNGHAYSELLNDVHWGSGNRGFTVRLYDGYVQFTVGINTSQWHDVTDLAHRVELGSWHRVRAILDLSEGATYISLDGYPQVRSAMPIGAVYSPSQLGYVRIGAIAQDAPARHFAGVFDEVRVTATR